MTLPKTDNNGGSVMETQRLKQAVILKGSPKGFFNPVIPRVFWQPTPSSVPRIPSIRISPWFCFKIPNPELQIRVIPYPEKPLGDPLLSMTASLRIWRYFFVPRPHFPFLDHGSAGKTLIAHRDNTAGYTGYMTACLNLARVKKICLRFLVNVNFLSRVVESSLRFSRASILLTFDATCTLDSHSKTPPSGLDLVPQSGV